MSFCRLVDTKKEVECPNCFEKSHQYVDHPVKKGKKHSSGCKECVLEWIKRNNETYPMCREEIDLAGILNDKEILVLAAEQRDAAKKELKKVKTELASAEEVASTVNETNRILKSNQEILHRRLAARNRSHCAMTLFACVISAYVGGFFFSASC